MHGVLFGVLSGCLIASAAPLGAQTMVPESAFRNDGTTVLQPATPPSAQRDSGAAAFRNVYARAGSPRFVVLWDQELGDTLSSGRATRTTIETADSTHRQGNAGATRVTTESLQPPASRAMPADRADALVRGDFLKALADAGMRLVDSEVILRNVATPSMRDVAQAGALTAQQLEMQALREHAQCLLTVQRIRGTPTAADAVFQVSALRLTDGAILSSLTVDIAAVARSASTPVRYVADPQGGYRAVQAVAAPGSVLAGQILARLAEALAR
ncbi:hypothetical protein [Cupriavidus numazuensis]|uniref:Lipoprotein n=1 Tax=Cupriavidus numazuensis TaxID=221992 RepID=A0ABM8TJY0_9BURK|nr:hypothetical protein [Cupriavidus numazuensis]CAG2150661.1 hypothetical protein LMG26411_03777 [Cupriavidus numazuensis]